MYTKAVLTTLALSATGALAASGSGTTTRYWDCCKPSCAWSEKADVSAPVTTCDKSDSPLTDPDVKSGCDGGSAFTCTDNSPWAVNDTLAYGFAATTVSGGSESSWCCACYELTFTSTALAGKKMIVQATNTGGDLSSNQFDILIPGGGVGLFDGCTPEFGAPLPGQTYGGVSDASGCDDPNMPASLKEGCQFRFGWYMGADNPNVDFRQVQCPAEITDKTGCTRSDDASFPKVAA
ncbi:K-family cellulase [Xylariomycetidae sp. FL0641]|nr:K-family cellulase [Xylariomycetidae sp. FL0641]